MNSNNHSNIQAYLHLKASLKLMGWEPKHKEYFTKSPFSWIDPTKQIQIKRINRLTYKNENEPTQYQYAIVAESEGRLDIYEKCDSYSDLLKCIANFDMNRIKK